MNLDISNEIEPSKCSLVDYDEFTNQQKQKELKKKKIIRYSIIFGVLTLAIIAIIIFVILHKNKDKKEEPKEQGEKKDDDHKYFNVIKAKYIINTNNTKIKLINGINDNLTVSLFIDNEKKVFSNEYEFNEIKEYLMILNI